MKNNYQKADFRYFSAIRKRFKKVDAPKNRGVFNDCLPYENSYINPAIITSNLAGCVNYFLTESITALAESMVDFAESMVTLAESITAEAESTVAVAVESVVVDVEAESLQAAKVAAIANTNNTFFIFLIFNCYLKINTEC